MAQFTFVAPTATVAPTTALTLTSTPQVATLVARFWEEAVARALPTHWLLATLYQAEAHFEGLPLEASDEAFEAAGEALRLLKAAYYGG